jgi:prepilin-type N-terminal cleavage/methylation domain-containing protein
MHTPRRDGRHAFTLLEMGIVLAIIGLLIGAVIGGQALLRQSELQTVIAGHTKYSSAIAQFRQQYGSLPGDIIDADSYWSTATNGNGDNEINDSTESFQAWLHLALAKMVDGAYSGAAGGGGATHAIIGTNVPRGRLTNTGWTIYYKGTTSGDTNYYNQDLANYLAFGTPVTNAMTQGAALRPAEAWQIDKKIDNALPATGRVMAMKPAFLADCATSATDATAEYKLTFRNPACGLNMSITLK